MSGKIIPPKACRFCGDYFTPTREAQLYCPRPAKCSHHAQGRRLKGIAPVKATEARLARSKARREGKLAERFGALSEREQAIYHAGYERGYDVGYGALLR